MNFELGFSAFVLLIAASFVSIEIKGIKQDYNNLKTRLDKVVGVLTFIQVILSRRSERNRYYRIQSLDIIERSNRKKKPVSDAAYGKMKSLTKEVNDIDNEELEKIDELISALSTDVSDTSEKRDNEGD